MIPHLHHFLSLTFPLSLSIYLTLSLSLSLSLLSSSLFWDKTMNIFSNGPSREDDFEEKENRVGSCIAEDIETEAEERSNFVMDTTMMMMNHNHENGVEFEFEIWPVEHPMEPPDEDRPVKCPIPHSSVINEEGKREKRVALAENSTVVKKGGEEEDDEEEVGAVIERPVRKRHHMTLTGENEYTDDDDDDDDDDDFSSNDKTIMPLTRMSPLPPLPTQNLTIFQMLQQFDKFDS
ncbi:uncharacterized protein LOC133824353 [Humulus lupulus]|uniref:uncharacterized protein LOC133824353 n=1 Tax=Humulus lupulus TaxID=3486 RepID=UPI002B400C04|nr:uncharacterized protein LOC133824353 [Humulus lupulus]